MKQSTYYRHSSAEFPVQIVYFPHALIPKLPAFSFCNGDKIMLLYMYQGRVECGPLNATQVLEAGDIALVPPWQIYRFRNVSEESKYIHMFIEMDMWKLPAGHLLRDCLLEPLRNKTVRVPWFFRPGDRIYDTLRRQLQRLSPEKEGSEHYEAEIFSVVTECICALLEVAETVEPVINKKEEAVAKCLEYIGNNYAQRITLKQLADLAGMRPNQLCAVFRELTERTPFDHLLRQRTRSAGRLLRSTLLPIPEVGKRCGFASNSFFIRKFSDVYHMTPNQYRKKYYDIYRQD